MNSEKDKKEGELVDRLNQFMGRTEIAVEILATLQRIEANTRDISIKLTQQTPIQTQKPPENTASKPDKPAKEKAPLKSQRPKRKGKSSMLEREC